MGSVLRPGDRAVGGKGVVLPCGVCDLAEDPSRRKPSGLSASGEAHGPWLLCPAPSLSHVCL